MSSVVCNLFSRGIDFDVFAFVEKTDSSEKDYFYPHKGLMAVARPHEILKTNLEALKLAGGVA
ncbi:hypothetical protein FY034_18060 (plasmid) [Trichlorobacter lovleyi]|nr:hypothetical protein FY034_18060 [Trichlorobacter lovleyi]